MDKRSQNTRRDFVGIEIDMAIVLQLLAVVILGLFGCRTTRVQQSETVRSINVFFPNSKLDPEVHCLRGYPVPRTIQHAETIEDTLKLAAAEYLKGPTAMEQQQGYHTAMPSHSEILKQKGYFIEAFGGSQDDTVVTVKEVSIDHDSVFVRLSPSSQAYGGGSCRVDGMLGPLRQTVKALYPSARAIGIFVKGHDQDSFQP